jgi:hypothetical protein
MNQLESLTTNRMMRAHDEGVCKGAQILDHACHGDDTQLAIRADETAAALQRLKWELERVRQKEHAAAG